MAKKKKQAAGIDLFGKFAQLYSVPSLFVIAGLDYITSATTYIPTLGLQLFVASFFILSWIEFGIFKSGKITTTEGASKMFAIIAASALIAVPNFLIGLMFVTVIGSLKFGSTTK